MKCKSRGLRDHLVRIEKRTYDLENPPFWNEFRIYVDIMTGEKLSSIYLANMELIYRSVRSYSRGGDGIEGVDRVHGYFSTLSVSHENMV